MSQHVRIVMTGHGKGEVFVDGVKINGIHTVTLQATSKEPAFNDVVLHLHPQVVEVEGPFDVTTIESEAREHRVSPHLPGPMPKRPEPPENRVSFAGFLCSFEGSQSDFRHWIAQPWWRRVLGLA